MKIVKRNKLIVDRTVQGAIVQRIVTYGLCCGLFIILPLLIVWELTHPDDFFVNCLSDIWRQYRLVFCIMAAMLPVAILDVVKWSNRFAGPVYRLRNALDQLASGETVPPLHFRDNDYWQDLAESFNRVSKRLADRETGSDRRTIK